MEAAELVVRYIETSLPSPEITWGRREFDQRIYERWAADELLGILLNQGNHDPIELTEKYLLYLLEATSSCVDNKKLIFSSAIHTVENILNLLTKEYFV